MSAVLKVTAEAIQLGQRRALRTFIPIPAGGATGELHIAMVSEWRGHPAGPFAITEQTIDDMIARFNAQQNPLLVDYEHRSLNSSGTSEDGKAAGWIKRLYKKGSGETAELWATVDWTAPAAEMIKQGEYVYCSPVIDFDSIDRKTGDAVGVELFNVALTNNPFIDGQKPTRLTRIAAAYQTPKDEEEAEQKKKQAAPQEQQMPMPMAEGEMPPADPAQQMEPAAQQPQAMQPNDAMAQGLVTFVEMVAQAAGVDKAAAIAALQEQSDEIGQLIREALDRDGMPSEERAMSKTKEQEAAEQEAARLAKIAEEAKDNEIKLLSKRLEESEAKIAKLETSDTDRAKREQEQKDAADSKRISLMLSNGQLLDTEKDGALFMLQRDPALFEKTFGSRKGSRKPVPIGEEQAEPEKVDPEKATAADLQEHEMGTYRVLTKNGYSPERAVKRIVENRNKKQRKAG